MTPTTQDQVARLMGCAHRLSCAYIVKDAVAVQRETSILQDVLPLLYEYEGGLEVATTCYVHLTAIIEHRSPYAVLTEPTPGGVKEPYLEDGFMRSHFNVGWPRGAVARRFECMRQELIDCAVRDGGGKL